MTPLRRRRLAVALRQRRCQRVEFALELGDAAVGLLLALARRRGDDALAPGLGAALARLRGRRIDDAFDLEPATGVAGAGTLSVEAFRRRSKGSVRY
jgi:hypothetical protein